MPLQESPNYQEIVDLILKRADKNDTAYIVTVDFILDDGKTINTYKVHSVDILRDFANSYSDYVNVVVTMNRLAYREYIYLNRAKLKARVTFESADTKSGMPTGNKISSEYTAKILNTTDESLQVGSQAGSTPKAISMEMVDVPLQLTPSMVETYRFINVSGIIRSTSPEHILKAIMSNFGDYRVVIQDPDNIEPCSQIIVPQGMNLSQFPYWLQKYGGGVYSYDIGFYIYNKEINIYPLFNTAKNPDRRSITICVVAPGRLEGNDSTYAIEGNKLRILSAGMVESKDTTEPNEYNGCNGVAFNEPNLLGDAIKTEQGKATVTGSKYREHALDEHKLNNLQTPKRITANVNYEVSRLARNRGMYAHLKWGNANPSMIQPNTEVNIMYDSGGHINTRRGVVLGVDFKSHARTDNSGNGSHTVDAILHVYLDKDAK